MRRAAGLSVSLTKEPWLVITYWPFFIITLWFILITPLIGLAMLFKGRHIIIYYFSSRLMPLTARGMAKPGYRSLCIQAFIKIANNIPKALSKFIMHEL